MTLLRVLVVAIATLAVGQAPAAGLSDTRGGVFKVVKPPARGARRLLTIHPVRRGLPPGAERPRRRYDWFWRVASPRLDAADPARAAGLAAVAARTISNDASRALVARIGQSFRDDISAAARAGGISEALLIAVIAAESAGKPRATSKRGAQGLAQLMPSTAARFGVTDAYDPGENLRGAATYLALLLDQFGGDAVLALAGYNAGENAVLRAGGVPMFDETRDYVPKVLSYFHAAKALCANPDGQKADGPRDACAIRADA